MSASPRFSALTTGPKASLAPLSLWHCLGGAALGSSLLMLAAVLVSNTVPHAGRLTQAAFINWDVGHYLYIRWHGYDVQRTAFFPLFPFLWRWLNVPPMGMGLFNLGLFTGTFAVLAWQLGWTWRQQALLLVVPSLVFMALPYSEAVFFACGVLVLVGLHRQHLGLYGLGLGLSCFSRSAALVLVPAVLLTAWLTAQDRRAALRAGLVGTGAALVGLAASVTVHYWYTGRWLVFFAAQRLWGNQLRWPALPFTNWGGSFPSRFEAPAFLIGVVCAAVLLRVGGRHWRRPLAPAAGPAVFALAYVAGITAVTVATKGGLLVSLSRYVYATPYFLLLLAELVGRVRLTTRHLLLCFGLMELTWVGLFGAYGHIRSFLGFTFVSGCVLLWLANAHAHPLVRRYALVPTVLGSAALLLVLLFRFLRHEWVA